MKAYGVPRNSYYNTPYPDSADLLRMGKTWRKARDRRFVRRQFKKAERRAVIGMILAGAE